MQTACQQRQWIAPVIALGALAAIIGMAWLDTRCWARAAVRFTESGDALVLTDEHAEGLPMMRIPVHRQGIARYFSAGVGIEERNAVYPPFALKLMFTAGGRPYVAGVAVSVENIKTGERLEVPEDHVKGPWLFVDLSSGTYRISATLGERNEAVTGVRLESGTTRTVHLRWAEAPGELSGVARE